MALLLEERQPGSAARVHVLEMDTTKRETVDSASYQARKQMEGAKLYGLVNNAGVAKGDSQKVVGVNLTGTRNVCEAFADLLAPGARVVNVSSGSAAMFVAKCAPQRKAFFTNPNITLHELETAVALFCSAVDAADLHLASGGDCGAALQRLGFPTPSEAAAGGGLAYGFSKACVNSYTLLCAAGNGPLAPAPAVYVNSLSPGFIATDLTRDMTEGKGVTPEEMGALPPYEGTHAIFKLLFSPTSTSGRYYGSDGLRSPLDKYRQPGTAEYTETA